jgi:hypothetical protein
MAAAEGRRGQTRADRFTSILFCDAAGATHSEDVGVDRADEAIAGTRKRRRKAMMGGDRDDPRETARLLLQKHAQRRTTYDGSGRSGGTAPTGAHTSAGRRRQA